MTGNPLHDGAVADAPETHLREALADVGLRFAATAAGRVVRFVFRVLVLISALGVAITIYEGTGLWWPAALSGAVIVAGWVWLGRRWSRRIADRPGYSTADGDAS